jgi:hypothetical protein
MRVKRRSRSEDDAISNEIGECHSAKVGIDFNPLELFRLPVWLQT